MPVCQKCDYKWRWKETVRKSFTLGPEIYCPHCDEKQYTSSATRKKTSMITFLAIAVVMLSNMFFGPSLLFLLMLIAFTVLIFVGYPFWLELSSEEEPLF